MRHLNQLCLFSSLFILASNPLFAGDEAAGRDEFIGMLVKGIYALDSFVFQTISLFGTEVTLIVLWMGAPMVLLTFYFGFINLRSFKPAWNIIRGKYHDTTAPGEVSQFQALSTALSGTVGLGNIAGVAAAISLGGPGACFWMVVIGFFAMTLKFAECTLGVKYRKIEEDGTVSGGPMYYLQKGLQEKGWPRFGKTLAWSYALLALPSLLQIAQVNQSFEAINVVADWQGGIYRWGYGLLIALLTATVITGGIHSIGRVTSRLVPAMAFIYIGAALVIIVGNFTTIPHALGVIVQEAFSTNSIAGGILGIIVIGMQRAVYSTEAGLGSATMAHAAAKTHHPVSEGLVALMEPFIDTVIISSMTALVIVITGVYHHSEGITGVSLTSQAFGSVFGWFPWVLALAAFLFAFSTIISWGYYSGKIWSFLFGNSFKSKTLFQFTFCIALIPGAVLTLEEAYMLMDSLFFLMAVPNIIGIYILAPSLKHELKTYMLMIRST